MPNYDADSGDLEAVKAIAEEHGFCLVRNVFSPAEIEKIKAGMKETHAVFGDEAPDLLSCPALAWLLFDDRIVSLARRLLGDELVYYAESNLNYEEEIGPYTLSPLMDLHCDALGRADNLWEAWRNPTDEIYPAYRFALYFHDYGVSSGALKVAVGSHRGDPDPITKSGGLSTQTRGMSYGGQDFQIFTPSIPLYDVPARAGDVVIWNLRTFHSAGAKRLRSSPDIALHPSVEKNLAKIVPEAFYPHPGPRIAVFFDYGAAAEGTDLYIKNRAFGRAARGQLSYAHSAHDSPANLELARRHGVTVRHDSLIIALAVALTDRKASDVNATAHRLMNLLVSYRAFSPHFPLFDSAKFHTELRTDRVCAVRNVALAIGQLCREMRRHAGG